MDNTARRKVNAKGGFSRLGEDAAMRQVMAVLDDESITQAQALKRLRAIFAANGNAPRKQRGA